MSKKEIRKIKPVLYFAWAGVIGYVVDLAVTLLFTPLLGKYVARIPAFLCSSTSTWIFNRNFTFKDSRSNKKLFAEWLHYESLMLGGLVVNYAVYAGVVSFLPNSILSTAVAIGVAALCGMVVNFLSSSKFLYNK